MRHTPLVDLGQARNRRAVELVNHLALCQVGRAVNVFRHHHAHKLRVVVVVVVGVGDQRAQRLHWLLPLQVQICFNIADMAVRLLQCGKIQAFFATKIVVNHAFAGLGGVGNGVNAGPGQAFFAKLLLGHGQDAGFSAFGVIGAGRRCHTQGGRWFCVAFAQMY